MGRERKVIKGEEDDGGKVRSFIGETRMIFCEEVFR